MAVSRTGMVGEVNSNIRHLLDFVIFLFPPARYPGAALLAPPGRLRYERRVFPTGSLFSGDSEGLNMSIRSHLCVVLWG